MGRRGPLAVSVDSGGHEYSGLNPGHLEAMLCQLNVLSSSVASQDLLCSLVRFGLRSFAPHNLIATFASQAH